MPVKNVLAALGNDVRSTVTRVRRELPDRLSLLRGRWRLMLRLALAVSMSLLIAVKVLQHEQAFFAPVAAAITVLVGQGVRVHTAFELVLGVAVGVLIGELIVLGIGRGWWQIGLVVALAVAVSTIAGLGGMALNQSATSSALLVGVIPIAGATNPAATRFIDALIGGLSGLIMSMLIVRDPVRDIDRDVKRVLTRLSDALATTALALQTTDVGMADRALRAAREAQPEVQSMIDTASSVTEVARLSPVRWYRRGRVATYVATVADLDNAIRDVRVLARRSSTLLRHGEKIPGKMDEAVDQLATAMAMFASDLSEQEAFDQTRSHLLAAARTATSSVAGSATINSAAVAAQVRALAADLLQAMGNTQTQIDRLLDFG